MAKGDPFWTHARFASTDANGLPVRKGDRIFYYPRTRKVLSGEAAEQASREFESMRFDEAMMTGEW